MKKSLILQLAVVALLGVATACTNPKTANQYINRGEIYLEEGDFDRAIADYTQAIRIEPNNAYVAYAYAGRGNAYRLKGNYDQAIADSTQAIRIKPKLADTYYNRGIAYTNKEDFDRAIADFTQAILINPLPADTYYYRGIAYTNKEDYDRAIVDFTKAILIYPDNVVIICRRNLFNRYKYKCETQNVSNFTEAEAYSNRGFAYYNKGDYDLAIADLDQAIGLIPKSANPYLQRAFTFMKKGDYIQARTDVNTALQIDPNYQSAKELSAELNQLGY